MTFDQAKVAFTGVFSWLAPLLSRWGSGMLAGIVLVVIVVITLLAFIRKG